MSTRQRKLFWTGTILAICVIVLCLLLFPTLARFDSKKIDMSLRHADYPSTFIQTINVDLTSPNHWVRLEWAGPHADEQQVGPYRSSPGTGWGTNDCNDPAESNCLGSDCTPKGVFDVEGFSDYLPSYPDFQFVTWINRKRRIAFHSHPDVANYPSSHGCIRLQPLAAQLIHNNSIIGTTKVVIDGTWTLPPEMAQLLKSNAQLSDTSSSTETPTTPK